MEVFSTTNPRTAERIRIYSENMVLDGFVTEVKNFDTGSTWHNSKYKCLSTNREWVVYLPDHAFGGEVKVVSA
jgi:hypothetical protein